jgi:hypothetical protein
VMVDEWSKHRAVIPTNVMKMPQQKTVYARGSHSPPGNLFHF